jgi:hypothetical protein
MAALNHHIQNLALAINCPPQEHVSATSSEHHFVKVPSVIRPRPLAHKTGCNLGPTFIAEGGRFRMPTIGIN